MNKINLKLEYKNNNEFNPDDYYVFEDLRFFISKVHKHNGTWYTNELLKYKAETVRCISLKEIKGKRVQMMNKDLKEGDEIYGTVCKHLTPLDLGIIWDQGRKRYLPTFWNNINNLRFL